MNKEPRKEQAFGKVTEKEKDSCVDKFPQLSSTLLVFPWIWSKSKCLISKIIKVWANCCPILKWKKLHSPALQLTPLDELVSCEPGFTGLSSPMDMVQVPNLKSFNFFANDWKQKADTSMTWQNSWNHWCQWLTEGLPKEIHHWFGIYGIP